MRKWIIKQDDNEDSNDDNDQDSNLPAEQPVLECFQLFLCERQAFCGQIITHT